MKQQLLLTIVAIIGFTTIGISQNLAQGESLLNFHAGISSQAGDPAKLDFPAIFATYEYLISDEISVGILGGYESATLESSFVEDESRTRYFAGALANLHLIDTDSFNGYLGGSLGYQGSNQEISNSFLYEFHAGLRFFLGSSFALVGEAGFGEISNIRLGVSFKL